MRSVIDRRLHFVIGKGGVGKTTVATALSLAFARRGRRTLVVEMDTGGRLPAMFGVSEAPTLPIPVEPGLHVLSIDGRVALEEYLGLVIPVKRLLSTIFSSRIYQYFVAAAPGLKELMTIGKIWYEVTREEAGRPVWDAIVVDAPATGHGIQSLRMPQAARDTFGAGLVQREAAKIVGLLQDAGTTAVHLVTLAEDMPVSETLETHAALTSELALPVGWVVVNRLHRRDFSRSVVERVESAAGRAQGDERALLAGVAERAIEESGWTTINAQNLARLRLEVGDVPIVELPFCFVEEFGRDAVDGLSGVLEAEIPAGEPVAARAKVP